MCIDSILQKLFIVGGYISVMWSCVLNIYDTSFVWQPISWLRCLIVFWRAIARNCLEWPTQSTTPDILRQISTFPTCPTRKMWKGGVHVSRRVLQDHRHFQWIRGGLHGRLGDLPRTFLMISESSLALTLKMHCFLACLYLTFASGICPFWKFGQV